MVDEARPSNPATGKKRSSRRGRQICLQVVVGMIILICGIIIGSGAAVLRLKDEMVMRRGPFPPTRAVVEDMAARYDLTPEQAEQVEAAFGKRRETLRTLSEQFRTKSEAEFQALSAEMKEILRPEQYERWDQDFKRRRRPGPPWERGRPGERGPGRRRRGGGFGDGGPGGRGPGGRDFRGRDRGPREPNSPGPNASEPGAPQPNTPSDQ